MGVLDHRVDGSHLHVVRHASQRLRQHQKHRYMVAICRFASSYRTVHGAKRIRSPHACLVTIGFRTMTAYLTIFVALTYGILDEMHQSSIEGRASEAIDVVADIFGSVLIVIFWLLLKKFPSKTQKNGNQRS